MWLLIVFDDVTEAHHAGQVAGGEAEQPGGHVGMPRAQTVQVEDEHAHGHRDGREDRDHHQVHPWTRRVHTAYCLVYLALPQVPSI